MRVYVQCKENLKLNAVAGPVTQASAKVLSSHVANEKTDYTEFVEIASIFKHRISKYQTSQAYSRIT